MDKFGESPALTGRDVKYTSTLIRVDYKKSTPSPPPTNNMLVERLVNGFRPKGKTRLIPLNLTLPRASDIEIVRKPQLIDLTRSIEPSRPNLAIEHPSSRPLLAISPPVRVQTRLRSEEDSDIEILITEPPRRKPRMLTERNELPAPIEVDQSVVPYKEKHKKEEKPKKKRGRKPKKKKPVDTSNENVLQVAIIPKKRGRPAKNKRLYIDESLGIGSSVKDFAFTNPPLTVMTIERPLSLSADQSIAEAIKTSPRQRRMSLQAQESANYLRLSGLHSKSKRVKEKATALEVYVPPKPKKDVNPHIYRSKRSNNDDSTEYIPKKRVKIRTESAQPKPVIEGSAQKRKKALPKKKPDASLIFDSFKVDVSDSKRLFTNWKTDTGTSPKKAEKIFTHYLARERSLSNNNKTETLVDSNNRLNTTTENINSMPPPIINFFVTPEANPPQSEGVINPFLDNLAKRSEEEALIKARQYKPTQRFKSFNDEPLCMDNEEHQNQLLENLEEIAKQSPEDNMMLLAVISDKQADQNLQPTENRSVPERPPFSDHSYDKTHGPKPIDNVPHNNSQREFIQNDYNNQLQVKISGGIEMDELTYTEEPLIQDDESFCNEIVCNDDEENFELSTIENDTVSTEPSNVTTTSLVDDHETIEIEIPTITWTPSPKMIEILSNSIEDTPEKIDQMPHQEIEPSSIAPTTVTEEFTSDDVLDSGFSDHTDRSSPDVEDHLLVELRRLQYEETPSNNPVDFPIPVADEVVISSQNVTPKKIKTYSKEKSHRRQSSQHLSKKSPKKVESDKHSPKKLHKKSEHFVKKNEKLKNKRKVIVIPPKPIDERIVNVSTAKSDEAPKPHQIVGFVNMFGDIPPSCRQPKKKKEEKKRKLVVPSAYFPDMTTPNRSKNT